MASFTYSRKIQILNVINRLRDRLVNNIKNDVTLDDFMQCYTMPEHRKTLTEIFDLVSLSNTTSGIAHKVNVQGGTAQLTLTLTFGQNDQKFLIPRYATKGMIGSAPEDSVKRIETWVKKRVAIGREMGLAYDVFNMVADKCASAKSVAFLMPSVVGLIGLIEEDETAKALQDKLSRTGLPPLPSFPPQVRAATKTAAETFARAMLLDRKAEVAPSVPVALHLGEVSRGKNPWGTSQTFL